MKIFIIGLPQSGRTTFAKEISNQLDFVYINTVSWHHLYRDKIIIETSNNFIIDNCLNPKDFISLFDHDNDIVIFLNRTNNEYEYKDYENIGLSVIRDYCYWMSSANLLDKKQWIEYNFKIPGDDIDSIKSLGSKNSIFIVKSIKKAINHLVEFLKN